MPKRTSKPKDIVARSITLKDSKGKTRVYMGIIGDPANSSICLFGERNRSIELSADHEGALGITLRDGTGNIAAGLGISSTDGVGLFLFDHRTGSRTELGSELAGGAHHITLHHRGKLLWTTKKKSPCKKSA